MKRGAKDTIENIVNLEVRQKKNNNSRGTIATMFMTMSLKKILLRLTNRQKTLLTNSLKTFMLQISVLQKVLGMQF